jgi:hypothetical protein
LQFAVYSSHTINKDKKEVLYIDNIHIYVDDKDTLVLEKKKGGRLSDLFVFVILPLVFIGFILMQATRIPTEPSFYIVAVLILAWLSAFMYFSIKLSALKYRTFSLRVENNTVHVNEEIFCKLSSFDGVIMREKPGDGKTSTTYHVGILSEGNYVFCALQQGLQDACAISGIIAHYFQKPIKIEDSKTRFFSFEYLSLNK